MKVLFFTHYTQLYGANRSLIDLIDGLGNKIVPIMIVPHKGDITKELKDRNISYFIIKSVFFFHNKTLGIIKIPLKIVNFLISLYKLFFIIRKINPDILYSNSAVIYSGLFISKVLRIPHIWHIRELIESQFKMKYDLGRKFNRFLLNQSDYLITNSEFTRKIVLNNINSPVSVIYNGVLANQAFKKYQNRSIPKKNIVISIVGRIMKDKGQLEAVIAVKDLLIANKNIELWIIGGIGEHDYYKKLIALIVSCNKANNIKVFEYTNEIEKIYSKTTLLLMCSQNEAMGRVTVEALARGIPVIGKNSGGTKELIIHGKTGYLYNQIDELQNYISLLVQNPDIYNQISCNAREDSYNKYSVENYSASIYKVLRQVSNVQ